MSTRERVRDAMHEVEFVRHPWGISDAWARWRLHLDRLDRYHGGGAMVVNEHAQAELELDLSSQDEPYELRTFPLRQIL